MQESTSIEGVVGVGGTTREEFDRQKKDLLYKLWDRMISGSYAQQKAGGKEWRFGILILLDRIAQHVVANISEPTVETEFHPN